MRAVHSIASIDPETGGPARTVTALCLALARQGVGTSLVTQEPRVQPLPFPVPHATRFARRGRFLGLRDFRRSVEAALPGPAPVVLHDHGLWLPNNHSVARLAAKHGVPRVLSPRGMLDGWALRWHGWRKRAAWRLYQRRDVADAALLHATSEAEAEALRRLGCHQPIAVVPNGVEVTPNPRAPDRARRRIALYLSRIHPKKGLLNLVEAWAALRPSGWSLWIAGSGERAHVAEVEQAARTALGADPEVVRFLGAVADAERPACLAQAELFILPTLSENFGQVVAEALAAGLPVITTRAAPWHVLVERGAGWWIEPGTDPLVEALRDALSRASTDLAAMGARGKAWATGTLAWDAVAQRMKAAYAWLLAEGAPTEDLRLEARA